MLKHSRVRVANTNGLPVFFLLHILGGDQKHECEVAWKNTTEFGLKYLT